MSLEDIMSYARGISPDRELRELEEKQVGFLFSRVKTLLMRDGQVEKDLIPKPLAFLIRGKHRVRLSIEKRVLLPDETKGYHPATVRLNTEFKILPQEQKPKIKDQDNLYIEILPEADQNNEFRNISILLGDDSGGHHWSRVSYSMDRLGNYDALNSDGCKVINQLLDLVERT